MRKPNYQQARKQKELSRKARQQEKQQRREVRPEADGVNPDAGTLESTQSTDDRATDDPTTGSGV
jgi:hypothetical protein